MTVLRSEVLGTWSAPNEGGEAEKRERAGINIKRERRELQAKIKNSTELFIRKACGGNALEIDQQQQLGGG